MFTLLLALAPLGTQVTNLGQIDFPTSGAPEAQAEFLRGALLLHSFEYDDAAEAFRAAQELDPDFALAYWGEAMTLEKPIWSREEPEEARAVLARLAPSPEERAAKAPTDRERGLLAAVETLFAEGRRHERRLAYSDAMRRLSERFPEDAEIASFHALSILGTSFGVRDIPTYMRAAAAAEDVYRANPEHPGALHYLIHCYDDPIHAPLGLRMARTYAKVAPAAQHALHMPSHIFVALGMWEESAASNVESAAAADARRERKQLSIEERGYHSLLWLSYSYLQLGRVTESRTLLADMQRDTEESGSKRTRTNLASMRAVDLVATRDWDSAPTRIEVDTTDFRLQAVTADLFVLGRAAIERGELDAARENLAEMVRRRDDVVSEEAEKIAAGCCLPGPGRGTGDEPPGRQAARVMENELAGLLALAVGDEDEGLRLLEEATRLEDARPLDFGPPVVVKPAHELLGEVLLALGRAEDARAEFDAALARAPRRALSLLGRARAAQLAGDVQLARDTYEELLSMWSGADEDLPGLRDARAEAGTLEAAAR